MKTLKVIYLTGLLALSPCALRAVAAGTGVGLCADYYNDVNFSHWALDVSSTGALNFDWASNSPVAQLDPDYFSIVWQGFLEPQYSETHVIYFRDDDGGRVYLNNTLILDNMLPPHGVAETSTSVALTAGLKVPIRVEMYENAGLAVAQLSWSSPSIAKQIIPETQLYCSYPGVPTLTPTPTPWAPACLVADPFAGPALQSFWKDRQIGLGLTGTAALASSLSVTASGITTSNKSDGFRYIYQESGGDFDVSVKVDFVGNANANGRAGLMARESLDPGARYAAIYASNSGSFMWQTRAATAANAGLFSAGVFNNNGLSPAWLRLKRAADNFSAYSSPDGLAWTQVGLTETVVLPPNILLGVAALSGSGGVLRAAEFENFKPQGCGLTPLWLEIYDSAGNLILRDDAGASASPLGPLNAPSGAWDPGQGALRLSCASWQYAYDGKDSAGAYLNNGVYLARVEDSSGKSSSAPFTVLRGEASVVRAWAGPNPVGKGGQALEIRWSPASTAMEIHGYSLAGDRVFDLGLVSGGNAHWELKGASDGVYFIALRAPGERRPRLIKVALAR